MKNARIVLIMKVLRTLGTIFTIIFGTLTMLLLRSVVWMFHTWNNLTMEELMFHIKSPLQGTNEGMVKDYIIYCVIISVVVMIALSLYFFFLRKTVLAHHISVMMILTICVVTTILSLRYVWVTLDISTYSSNQGTYSTFIDDNYVDPHAVELSFPEEKRNLIYIFLESMETTYSDKENGGGFVQNTIPELTQLAIAHEDFSGDADTLNGGLALTGSTWTIAAMFSQTSGLPLLIPIDGNSMNTQETFFPGICSIGDILDKAGYNQSLLIGSEAVFGGRELYFTTHGNYAMYDYTYAVETEQIPADYRVWWGYEDVRLFQFAKEHLQRISQEDEPFNFTMLTVDTHFENGYPCDKCPDTFEDNQYANVMSCSSKQVYDFVSWVQEQDFYDNTTIVIAGDHPTMDSDFCDDVDGAYERKTYLSIINAPIATEISDQRTFSTLDLFPTTLASLGVEIDGNRLGLGTNLFSSTQTLLERYGKDTINNEFQKKSTLMETLTSDIISLEELALQEEKAKKVHADVNVSAYDTQTESFNVHITNVETDLTLHSIRCAIWPEGPQNDLIWYDAQLQEDSSYLVNVKAEDFGYKNSSYCIHVYAIDSSGNAHFLDDTTGVIEIMIAPSITP